VRGDFVNPIMLRQATLFAAAALAGCYTYVPAEISTVPAGQEVRVYLTRGAVAGLPEDVAPTEVCWSGSAWDRVIRGRWPGT
jgi:hypothetical protein